MAVRYVRSSPQFHIVRNLDPRIAGVYGFTFSAWFNPDDTTSSAIVSLSTAGGTARHQLLSGTALQMVSVNAAGSSSSAASASAPTVGAWNHAFGQVEAAASRRVVLNGGTAIVDAPSITSATHDRFMIGARIAGGADGGGFSGAIAHVAVWASYLSIAEGHRLSRGESPLSIRPESLVYYFPLDGGPGFTRDVVQGAIAAPIANPIAAVYPGPPTIRPPRRSARIYSFPAAAGGAVTGTLAATEGADTATFTGDVIVQGALAASEGADSAAFAGDVVVQGALSATEGADTASISGDVLVQGALAATEGADTASFIGAGAAAAITGSLAATESGSDTAAVTGRVLVQGALAATEAADSAAFVGDVVVRGALAATETGSDTAAFTSGGLTTNPKVITITDVSLTIRATDGSNTIRVTAPPDWPRAA